MWRQLWGSQVFSSSPPLFFSNPISFLWVRDTPFSSYLKCCHSTLKIQSLWSCFHRQSKKFQASYSNHLVAMMFWKIFLNAKNVGIDLICMKEWWHPVATWACLYLQFTTTFQKYTSIFISITNTGQSTSFLIPSVPMDRHNNLLWVRNRPAGSG